MTIISSGIEGLDFVLSGGFQLVARKNRGPETTTILVRGPAGSGKTILGAALAASICRRLDSNAAYACVELLPLELAAQLSAVLPTGFVSVQSAKNSGEVETTEVASPVLLASLVEPGESSAQFETSLVEALNSAKAASSKRLGVLVVDSLADGYGLGAKTASRHLADGVCKLGISRGLIVILLEEVGVHESTPSPWAFAADIVLELSRGASSEGPDGALTISKCRFGPADQGPHGFTISGGRGVYVTPRSKAYRAGFASLPAEKRERIARGVAQNNVAWPAPLLKQANWLPKLRRSVVSIISPDYQTTLFLVLAMTNRIGGHQVRFRLGRSGATGLSKNARRSLYGQDPQRWSAALLWTTWKQLIGEGIGCIVIGDVNQISYTSSPPDLLFAIDTLSLMAREFEIPLFVYQTLSVGAAPHSFMYGVADVVAEVRREPKGNIVKFHSTLHGFADEVGLLELGKSEVAKAEP